MNEPVKKNRLTLAAAAMLLLALLVLRLPVSAEPASTNEEDLHSLLEKSLSVVEIDKEIGRIQEQKEQLTLQMTETERELTLQQEQISDKQDEAGNTLRAYYMGDRDYLFSALLSFDSLPELFQMLDYVQIILTHDKHTLNTYVEQYRKIKAGYEQLTTRQVELAAVEKQLQTQRGRVLALERQLDDQLAGRSDADRLRLLIQELTAFWETAGINEVKTYFRELSRAMRKLPDWVQDNKELLEIKGFNYTIKVPEDEINAFLREQNDIFNHFSFHFMNDQVIAQGQRGNMEIRIAGRYTIESEPKNAILFHVDELLFNGFKLPDTTGKALEQEFDLGFYPDLIVSFLKANDVQMKDGELTIKLSLKL
ncbi:coiled-coil domain-containing protein [Paenibacillus sp. sgz302251]|uniref:coiled-coil domain-containing protein n=1 Tax=Paenibacillus sp. sgz302251 TaxID=3414493 RepID=UPI003C7BBC40